LLTRVYKSLLNQTNKDFEWLIIDDGSTDGTNMKVFEWQKNSPFKIRYIWKENGGVHTARNLAYKEINTELCLQVDSDDWLLSYTIEKVLKFWEEYGSKQYCGIVGLCIDPSGNIIGTSLPNKISVPFRYLNSKYKVEGDKFHVFRTEVMKKIPEYPVFEGENRVPIAWKYSQIPDENEVLIYNIPLCVVEYQSDGISANIRKNYFKNPKGMTAGYEMILKHAYGIRQLIKGGIGYCTFSLLSRNKNFIKKSPKKFITILLFPLGVIGYIFINIKWRKYKNS